MIKRAIWSDFSGVDSSKALATFNRIIPPWISLLLVVAIAWQAGKIAWMLVPGPAAGDLVPLPSTMPAAPSQSGASPDVQAIADAHMFGVADEQSAVPVVVEEENLVDTRLTNLSLKGTIASDYPEFSVAVIADGNAEEKVYVIGDALGAGTTIHAIYPDRVVLNENGALTNLKLPKEFPAAVASATRQNMTSTRQVQDETQSIQDVVSENLAKLTDVIRPTPYMVNGEQAGYRVYPGRDRQQFAALGLRPGDLIMDIDGQSLSDPTQAMQIFQSLGTAEQVTVTVERNGQPETIVLSTSQLALGDEQTQ